MKRIQYFIHGNGQDSTCAPEGFLSDDMPGHGQSRDDVSKYSIEEIVKFYAKKIPANALVLGHSLGAHIALNVALIRPDIKIYLCGMAPIEGLEEIGPVMTPVAEFTAFQNPQRSDSDIVSFIGAMHSPSERVTSKLFAAAKKQDPAFNVTLFTSGIGNYDWSERTKLESLGERATLILSLNEKCYNAQFLLNSNLNILRNDYLDHTPWLYDKNWFLNLVNSMGSSDQVNQDSAQL
ncbi:MAG: hypothetical protein CME71_03575 [Halobacteriovorax sp.]|nr:hypothetical protein [Halobacteriovorax sp.]